MKYLLLVILCSVHINLIVGETEGSEPPVTLEQADSVSKGVSAKAVWSQFDGSYKILKSETADNEWLTPEVIYQSERPIYTPSLATIPEEGEFLVWSEQYKSSIKLMLSVRAAGMTEWGDPVILFDGGKENLSPVITQDLDQNLWVFWSSNASGNDDIYTIKKTFAGNWEAATKVHEPNSVPDYHPSLSFNSDGEIVLSWKHYDLQLQDYRLRERVFARPEGELSAKKPELLQPEVELSDIGLASFFPNDSTIMIEFPTNRRFRTVRYP